MTMERDRDFAKAEGGVARRECFVRDRSQFVFGDSITRILQVKYSEVSKRKKNWGCHIKQDWNSFSYSSALGLFVILCGNVPRET